MFGKHVCLCVYLDRMGLNTAMLFCNLLSQFLSCHVPWSTPYLCSDITNRGNAPQYGGSSISLVLFLLVSTVLYFSGSYKQLCVNPAWMDLQASVCSEDQTSRRDSADLVHAWPPASLPLTADVLETHHLSTSCTLYDLPILGFLLANPFLWPFLKAFSSRAMLLVSTGNSA